MPRTRFGVISLLGCLLGVLLVQLPSLCAQDAAPRPPLSRDSRVLEVREKTNKLHLIEKGSRIIQLQNRIATVDGFDDAVVKVMQVNNSAHQIRVVGMTSGVTTMVLVDEFGESYAIELLVSGDAKHLEAVIREVFPDSSVRCIRLKENVMLYGWVTQSDQINVIMDMAAKFFPEPLNYLRVSGDQQVMLHVKIMEVQRGKIRNLGFNFLELTRTAYATSSIGGLTPLTSLTVPFGGIPNANVNPTSSTATFGIVNNDNVFQGFIEALKQESLLKVLAEPNLVAINGRPANFLNGGEFPILVPQGLGTVSVQFRPFGVRLEFVANNLGNGRVRLDVTPEVSERDFTNTVTVGSVTIPALTVRRAQTQVEMNVSETLIIAGLISNRIQARTNKVPVLGELPLVGAAFRRISYDESETELLIMVTPELAGPITDGLVPPGPGSNTVSPTDSELFGRGYLETLKFGPDPDCENCFPAMGGMIAPGYDPNLQPLPADSPHLPPAVPPESFYSSPTPGPGPGPTGGLEPSTTPGLITPPSPAPAEAAPDAAKPPAPAAPPGNATSRRTLPGSRTTASRTATTPPRSTPKPKLSSPIHQPPPSGQPGLIQPVSANVPAATRSSTKPSLIMP